MEFYFVMTSDFPSIKKGLPRLGVGLGYRSQIAEATGANSESIDFLEVISEHFLNEDPVEIGTLEQLSGFKLIPHGIELSIGNMSDFDSDYLQRLKKLFERIDAPWWSDHLCFTGSKQNRLHDLFPLPFSREAVAHVVRRVKAVQSVIERPFLLENISAYVKMPGAELSEAQFIAEIIEQANCGLLLDVNNVYVNSVNHNYDPFEFIDQLPLERVVQIHIAGHRRMGSVLVDTHGAKIIQPVYDLLEYVLKRTEVKAILLERDQYFPRFESILKELGKLRALYSPAA